jgi:hypothetical protein
MRIIFLLDELAGSTNSHFAVSFTATFLDRDKFLTAHFTKEKFIIQIELANLDHPLYVGTYCYSIFLVDDLFNYKIQFSSHISMIFVISVPNYIYVIISNTMGKEFLTPGT